MAGKVTIRFFKEWQLELGASLQPDGGVEATKAFWKFLDRPNSPHISVLGNVHFTAGSGRSTPHRFQLVSRKGVSDAADQLTRSAANGYESYARALTPTTLEALEAGGWTVHWMRPTVIERWLRLAARGPAFDVDERSICAFVSHLVRSHARPRQLEEVSEPLLCLRWNGDDPRDVEAATLVWQPHGVTLAPVDANTAPLVIQPPGWYVLRIGEAGDAVRSELPKEPLRDGFRKVTEALRRYPKKGQRIHLDRLATPRFVSQLLGFFGTRLLHEAMRARLAHLARSSTP